MADDTLKCINAALMGQLKSLAEATQEQVAKNTQGAIELAQTILNLPDLASDYKIREVEYNQLSNELQLVREDNEENLKNIRALEENACKLRSTNTQNLHTIARLVSAPSAPATTANYHRLACMPEPEKYDGNRMQLPIWKGKLFLKLSEPGAFPDTQSKLRYTMGLLTGKASKLLANKVMDNGTVNFESLDSLIDSLNRAFGDPDPVGTAKRAVEQTFQRNKPFHEFLADISEHLAKLNWNDEAKKDAIHRNMNEEHKETEVHSDTIPEDLDGWIAWHQRFDSRLAARTQDKKNRGGPTHKQAPVRAASPGNGGRSTTRTAHNNHPTASNSGNYGPAPMDLSASKKKLSLEERSRRIHEGRCLYCGELGHISLDCPQLAQKRRLQGAATARATPASGSNNTHVEPVNATPLQHERQQSDYTAEEPKN